MRVGRQHRYVTVAYGMTEKSLLYWQLTCRAFPPDSGDGYSITLANGDYGSSISNEWRVILVPSNSCANTFH